MAIVPYQLYCPIDCQVNGGSTGVGIEWPSSWFVYLYLHKTLEGLFVDVCVT